MASPKGYFCASNGGATTLILASMPGHAVVGSITIGADNFVVRVEVGSARWTDGAVPPSATIGIPMLAADGPIRLGAYANVIMLGAGVLQIQGYQGFFNL
jgi:hypothetical protein